MAAEIGTIAMHVLLLGAVIFGAACLYLDWRNGV